MIKEQQEERFCVIKHNSIDETQWDQFVFDNRFGFVYYRYKYLIVDEEDNTINNSFMVFDKATQSLIALCPLFIKTIHNNITDIVCRNGILIKNDIGNNLRNKLSSFIISYLCSFLETSKNKVINAEIPALVCSEKTPLLNNALIFFGFKPGIRFTWITSIKADPNVLLSSFEPSTRRDIKNLTCLDEYYLEEVLDSTKKKNDKFDEILLLCKTTYSRNNVNPKSDDYYKNIYYNLDVSYRRIFILRNKTDNKAIVLAVFFIYGNKAHYAIGASVNCKKRGVSKLLIYKSFLKLREIGIEQVEMGGAYPYLPAGEKLRGISDFKKSFGCKLYPMHLGEFHYYKSYKK